MTENLSAEAMRPVPDGVFAGRKIAPQGESLTVASGRGSTITTTSGEEYLDYKLGSGPMILGHAHPHVTSALEDQVGTGETFYMPNDRALELAERVVDVSPCAESLKLVSTGTEATYLALRLAKAHAGAEKVLKFEGAYHGWHDQGIASSNKAETDRLLETEYPEATLDSAGVPRRVADETLIAPYNDLETTAEVVADHADDLAAIVVEPLMRIIPPEDGFLEGLRDLCDDHDVVLLFDEVVTGFRLALGGAQEYYGVEPDLVAYGKALGGGTPIGAVAGRADIMARTRIDRRPSDGGVTYAGTLNGNPITAAAANATLDVLERDGTYPQLRSFAADLRSAFDEILADSPLSGRAIGDGPMADYVLTTEPEITTWREYLATDLETKKAIDRQLFDANIIKTEGAKMYVSTAHDQSDLERTIDAFQDAVDQIA